MMPHIFTFMQVCVFIYIYLHSSNSECVKWIYIIGKMFEIWARKLLTVFKYVAEKIPLFD
jgi:hypothetical protein